MHAFMGTHTHTHMELERDDNESDENDARVCAFDHAAGPRS